MNVGEMNRRVTLYRNNPTRNELNELQDVATPENEIKRTWASIKPLTGREFWQAMQFNEEVKYKVIIRYIDGIENGCVIVSRDKRIIVQYGIPDDKRRYLILYCKDDANDSG